MDYNFPIIKNISDVLPAIEGCNEFNIAHKDGGYTIINYALAYDNTFPPIKTINDSIRRECRGLVFCTNTGNLLHRRLHKFFNVNEREETFVNNINFSQPHYILEKLDGSMITPIKTINGRRWGSKMGVTEVGLQVENFVSDKNNYTELCDYFEKQGITPIFEWCSNQQRIVVDYEKESLILIAARNNITGEYIDYKDLIFICNKFNIELVKQYDGTASNMGQLIDECKHLQNAEGFVIRFINGHMLKVKGEWYLQLHNAKEVIKYEKNIIDIIVSDRADDFKQFLLPADLKKFNDFEKRFWAGVVTTVKHLIDLRTTISNNVDRKVYATEFVQKHPKEYSSFLYLMYKTFSDSHVFNIVKDSILKNCSSQTKVDYIRWVFNCQWNT